VNFSRGLFGKPRDHAHVEKVLRTLSLWDKRNEKIMTLSGGMKRRVMIAKALSHEPQILFLDEPTAGVDVELRRDMWEMVRGLLFSMTPPLHTGTNAVPCSAGAARHRSPSTAKGKCWAL
jgi:ABC-type multidrug transport system ATPase subunit